MPEDRIEALRMAHEYGIETWVSLEPVLDPAQSLHLIDLTHEYVDFYGVGKLNTKKTSGTYQELKALESSINWLKYRADAEAKLQGYGKAYKIKQALADATNPKLDEPLKCAACGTNLEGKGQLTKGGKVYCAQLGCGYPKRGEGASTPLASESPKKAATLLVEDHQGEQDDQDVDGGDSLKKNGNKGIKADLRHSREYKAFLYDDAHTMELLDKFYGPDKWLALKSPERRAWWRVGYELQRRGDFKWTATEAGSVTENDEFYARLGARAYIDEVV